MYEKVLLRENTMIIINFINKKIKLITKDQQELYENGNICHEKIENKYLKDKEYSKVNDHCHCTGEYKGAEYSICDLKSSVPKKIHIVFHSESTYDYRFIIKTSADVLS